MSIPEEVINQARCGACTKCLSYFPVYIAQNKVPICGRCSEHLEDNTYIRDTPYEAVAQFLKFPCVYRTEGCLENLLPIDVPKHEDVCSFRIISCSLECMWHGTVNELLQHFEEMHPAAILRDGEFEMDFLNSYEIDSLIVYKDELFCFKRKFDYPGGILRCSLFCYRSVDSITKYNYQVIVQNAGKSQTVKFSPRSADNFRKENETEIEVEQIRNKLNDPSIIVGSVKITNMSEQQNSKESPKKEANPEIHLDMLAELECPVCMDYIIPPIYQCVTGHSICSECKDKVQECPSCKGEIKNTQNFTLEKMAYFLTYPCKFSEYGCDFSSKPGKIRQHQLYCLHGPHECPLKEYENCNWKNSVKQMWTHISEQHHDNILEIESISLFIGNNFLNEEESNCYILKFSNLLFKLHYQYRQKTFYWAMQLIGPPEEANQYKFEIDITDQSNKNRRMFLRNICAPLTSKHNCFAATDNYVFINLDQIRSFLSDFFTYSIRIVK